MIDNTSESMKDRGNRIAFLAAAMGPGGSDQAIAEQEARGQAQLVNSDRLPTDLHGERAAFEALGFTFGEPDPRDPMFMPATLPDGWKREGSDHDMWSYVVDELGRRRVGVFYKAAFYDRSAHMHIESVYGYLSSCVYYGRDIVTDDTWATPPAIAEAARQKAKSAEDSINLWAKGEQTEHSRQYVAEYTAERDKYLAIAAQFGAVSEA